MEEVAELVMLENVHYRKVVTGFHHTEETINWFLLIRVLIGNTEIEESLDFFWECRKFNENVLLIS